MLRFMVYHNKPRPAMGNNPVGDLLGLIACLWLCERLWEPRPRGYVYATQPVVVARPVVARPVVAQPVVYATGPAYVSKAPEPAPLPALALEVPPPPEPPKAEVVERV